MSLVWTIVEFRTSLLFWAGGHGLNPKEPFLHGCFPPSARHSTSILPPFTKIRLLFTQGVCSSAIMSTTTVVIELQEAHLPPRAAEPTGPSSPMRSPPQPRRVFEVNPATTISKQSRMLILCLIIAANLSQFVINFVTFAAGFSLNKAFGRDASPGNANWMAAAYSFVTPKPPDMYRNYLLYAE